MGVNVEIKPINVVINLSYQTVPISIAMAVPGSRGPRGLTGPQGPGVIPGGTTGQFYVKKSNDDYDGEWATFDMISRLQLNNWSLVTVTAMGISPIKSIAVNPNNPLDILIGGGSAKLCRSTNGGVSFGSLISVAGVFTGTIFGICYSTVTQNLVMAITDAGETGISVDGGATWSSVANPFGTSALNAIKCGSDGIFHVCGASKKYAKTTSSAGTTFTSLITIWALNVIADNIYIGSGFMIIAGHSAHISRSTNNGDSWTEISNPGASADALWGIDGHDQTVAICIYDSANNNQGKYFVSTDGGLTFGSIMQSPFSEVATRPHRIKYSNGFWVMVGDADSSNQPMMCYSSNLINWHRVYSTNVGNQIIFRVIANGINWFLVANGGIFAKSLSFQ